MSLEGRTSVDLFTSLRSGGYNWLGNFQNQEVTNVFDYEGRFFGNWVGVELAYRPFQRLGLGYLRVEWGRTFAAPSAGYDFVTGSFPGVPPFFFLYRTNVVKSASRADLCSVYYQQPIPMLTPMIRSIFDLSSQTPNSSSLASQLLSPSLELSLYAGVGTGKGKVLFAGSTDDLVVQGELPITSVDFHVKKVELGVELKITECLSLYYARRVYTYDLYESLLDMALVFPGPGIPGGNYSLTLGELSVTERRDIVGVRFRL